VNTVPGIDEALGLGVYSTEFEGLGSTTAKIRSTPDHFEVAEVLSKKALASINTTKDDTSDAGAANDGYAVYVLQKRGIDTAHALSAVHKRTGVRLKALGLKDATAQTTQHVCSMSAKRRPLPDIDSSKYSLRCIGFVKKPLTKKDMTGNRFRITINDPAGTAWENNCALFDEYDRILNFYGYQRFGSRRPVTHLIGRAVVRRDFDEAVRLILEFELPRGADSGGSLHRDGLLDDAMNGKPSEFPAGMDVERLVYDAVSRYKNAAMAFRAVPLQLRRLYVNAYQSYIFNRTLSAAFADGEDLTHAVKGDVCSDSIGNLAKSDGSGAAYDLAGSGGGSVGGSDTSMRRHAGVAVPICGYSYYSKTRFATYTSYVMEDEGVSHKDFYIKEMQECSGEGGFRDAIVRCWGYSCDPDRRVVEFTLSRGSYATVVLREIIKPSDPLAAGF